jgi:hypothetical protein
MNKMDEKLILNNKLISLYKEMNVRDITDKILELNDIELYKLSVASIMYHDYNDITFIKNMKVVPDSILKKIEEIEYEKVQIDVFDENNEKIPNPFTKKEIREMKIKEVNDDSDI